MTALSLYWGLLTVIAVQRLFEIRKAERNAKNLLADGGREFGQSHYGWMVLLHTAWLGACAFEAWLHGTPPGTFVSLLGMALTVAGQAFRMLAMNGLKEQWTTRIIVLPGKEPVGTGIFAKIRHPNYLGVIMEVAGLPLVFGNWVSFVVFSILNGILLAARIKEEERAMQDLPGYASSLGELNRFLPKM